MTDTLIYWALTAALLPIFSCLVAYSFARRFGGLIPVMCSIFSLCATVAATFVFIQIWNQHPVKYDWLWFAMGKNTINIQLHLSNLSALMMVVVTLISFLVHLYSMGYMADDAHQPRYFAMLGFFTFSMLGVVLAGNLLQLFFCWELMGFSSYMLIGHWRQRKEAAAAGFKAFVMNRIGDMGLLITLMIIWTNLSTLEIDALTAVDMGEPWIMWAGIFTVVGVLGKSAQFPLLTWLPDAMEGPTPVSALIHAATMVAAGVFLLIRLFPIFTPEVLTIITIIGALTSLLGSVCALLQFDIKKILAYSTISQLGLMVLAIGQGAPGAAMLHLFTHAFFKAGLFLAAGAVIYALHQANPADHDIQDIRNMSGLNKRMPFTFWIFLIITASLSGLPFTSGFLSKDAILSSVSSLEIRILATSISMLTVAYSFRLIWFMSRSSSEIQPLQEPPLSLRLPIILLAIASTWAIVSINPFEFRGWLLAGLQPQLQIHFRFAAITSANVLFITLSCCFFYYRNRTLPPQHQPAGLLQSALGLDWLYQIFVTNNTVRLARITTFLDKKVIDKVLHLAAYGQVTLAYLSGWLDKYFVDGSVNGIARISGGVGALTRSLAGGKIQSYILWSTVILITLVIWFLFFTHI